MNKRRQMTSGAWRQKVYRHRQDRRINVYPVEVDDQGLAGLIDTGRLTVWEATDKQKVAAAIAELIRCLGKAKQAG